MKNNERLSEILYPVVNETWAALKRTCQGYARKDRFLEFNDAGYGEFSKQFETLYSTIMKQYMKQSVLELDRHKLASVMIISCINAKLISYQTDKIPKKAIFLGAEMIATEVALSWMLEGLNDALKEKGIRNQIEHYIMPTAFACETPYFEIFSRNLLYANTNYTLNPLDISDKLFLLEYITLLENHIDPTVLKHST